MEVGASPEPRPGPEVPSARVLEGSGRAESGASLSPLPLALPVAGCGGRGAGSSLTPPRSPGGSRRPRGPAGSPAPAAVEAALPARPGGAG